LFLSVQNKAIINSIFNKPDAFNLVFKSFAVLMFFTSTMLNIDTIRAIEKTMMSELYRNIFRYTPVFIGTVVLFFTNRQDLIVDVYLAGFFILSVISSIHVLLSFKKGSYTQKNILSYTTKEILKVSTPMAISAMAYFVMQSIDVIILAIYEGFDKLAYYSVSVKLATLIALALLSVNIVVAPKIAELYEKKKTKEMQEIIKKSTRIIFIISVVTLLFLVFFSETILGLFGQNYLVAKQALIILIFGQFFNSLSGPGAIYLNMTKRQGVLNKILLTGLIVNIGLNFYLIPSYGISGAAIATLISFVFWNLIIILYIYHKDRVKVFLT
jgi:O-antigen/teichoic acid export membrane protein